MPVRKRWWMVVTLLFGGRVAFAIVLCMRDMYATGRVILPVTLRQVLGIQPGQTVASRQSGDEVIVQTLNSVDDVRAMLERAARQNGTWGKTYDINAVRAESAVRRYIDS